MKKEIIIKIINYCLITAIITSWIYDFYLFYKYDRFHPIHPRAWPLINVKIARVQLAVSSALIIFYLTLNKIRLYRLRILVCIFIFALYVQDLILLYRWYFSTTLGVNYPISDVIKMIVLPLLMIYIFLLKYKRLGDI